MKNILMVASEVPPCLSAGVQRTFHFAENLNQQGWFPYILSAHERIYARKDQETEFSPSISKNITRAFAIDITKHLAYKGKYWGFLESPDRFGSWYYSGWRKGVSIVNNKNIDVIWSTFPISTAHRIALKVKKQTGVPWVADFRDPLHMHVDSQAPIRTMTKRIDRETIELADRLVFATKKMSQLYQAAYPYVDLKKFSVIENGYDESNFSSLRSSNGRSDKFTLLYSGALYSEGRDPTQLFEALFVLKKENVLSENDFELVFRGAGDGLKFSSLIKKLGLASMVRFLPSISYKKSIQEMVDADALLVIQGGVFNNQIPGKVYEYIASKNSILALVGSNGATQELLGRVSQAAVAVEGDVQQTVSALKKVISNELAIDSEIQQYSRKARSQELVSLLNEF